MKKIAVFGATGSQGGSVARHLLATGRYGVRAITRTPKSAEADALRKLGAQIVHADLASPPSLNAALRGVQGVFGVTNYFEHYAVEAQLGRNLVEAVSAANVEHFVYSTLEPIAKLSAGELRSPHFDIKAEHEELTRKRGIPSTFIHMSFYYENFFGFFPPVPAGEGSFEFALPLCDTPLAAVSVEDTGRIVAAAFDGKPSGQTVNVAGDEMPVAAYAAILTSALGAKFRYRPVTREKFAEMCDADIADMFEYYRTYAARRRSDVAPGMQSFVAWATANASKLRATLRQVA